MLYNLSMACRIEQGYNSGNTTYAAALQQGIRASAELHTYEETLQQALEESNKQAVEEERFQKELAQAMRASEREAELDRLAREAMRCQTDEEALAIALERSCVDELGKLTSQFKQAPGTAVAFFGSVVANPGGGNCLFHALSDCIYPTPLSATDLRRLAVRLILMQWERFSPFAQKMNGDALTTQRAYAEYMGKDGTWGDHLPLLMLCEHLHLHAVVHVHHGGTNIGTIHINREGTKEVHLRFTQECHYEAIVT